MQVSLKRCGSRFYRHSAAAFARYTASLASESRIAAATARPSTAWPPAQRSRQPLYPQADPAPGMLLAGQHVDFDFCCVMPFDLSPTEVVVITQVHAMGAHTPYLRAEMRIIGLVCEIFCKTESVYTKALEALG